MRKDYQPIETVLLGSKRLVQKHQQNPELQMTQLASTVLSDCVELRHNSHPLCTPHAWTLFRVKACEASGQLGNIEKFRTVLDPVPEGYTFLHMEAALEAFKPTLKQGPPDPVADPFKKPRKPTELQSHISTPRLVYSGPEGTAYYFTVIDVYRWSSRDQQERRITEWYLVSDNPPWEGCSLVSEFWVNMLKWPPSRMSRYAHSSAYVPLLYSQMEQPSETSGQIATELDTHFGNPHEVQWTVPTPWEDNLFHTIVLKEVHPSRLVEEKYTGPVYTLWDGDCNDLSYIPWTGDVDGTFDTETLEGNYTTIHCPGPEYGSRKYRVLLNGIPQEKLDKLDLDQPCWEREMIAGEATESLRLHYPHKDQTLWEHLKAYTLANGSKPE